MFKRFRRLRLNENLRAMVRENSLSVNDLIYPLFVVNGTGIKKEISSMPDVFQMSLDEILKECQNVVNLGIKALYFLAFWKMRKKTAVEAML